MDNNKTYNKDENLGNEMIAALPDLIVALEEALQSLEYVHRMHPEVTGGFKRVADIWRAKDVLKRIGRQYVSMERA